MKNKIAFNDMSTALKIFCQKSWAWGRATRMINYIHIESISNFMTEVRATKWGKIIFRRELLFLSMLLLKVAVFQGVSCDRFLGRMHAPRTSRLRCARTRVRTPNLRWSHFAPAL